MEPATCGKCGYELTGLPLVDGRVVCPECGGIDRPAVAAPAWSRYLFLLVLPVGISIIPCPIVAHHVPEQKDSFRQIGAIIIDLPLLMLGAAVVSLLLSKLAVRGLRLAGWSVIPRTAKRLAIVAALSALVFGFVFGPMLGFTLAVGHGLLGVR